MINNDLASTINFLLYNVCQYKYNDLDECLYSPIAPKLAAEEVCDCPTVGELIFLIKYKSLDQVENSALSELVDKLKRIENERD